MVSPNLNGLFIGLVIFGLLMGFFLWGAWELIDWLWLDDSIRVSRPLIPEVEIHEVNGVRDTLYIYRPPFK